jgi:hypothetical protein
MASVIRVTSNRLCDRLELGGGARAREARSPPVADPSAVCGSGEMANTLALGASAERLRGSSPLFRTNNKIKVYASLTKGDGWPFGLEHNRTPTIFIFQFEDQSTDHNA